MFGGTLLLVLLNDATAPDAANVLSVGVGNSGTGDIDVGVLSIVGDSAFSITTDPVSSTTLLPGDQRTVKVTLDIATPGTYTAILRVPSSDPDGTLDVNLMGVVTAALVAVMSVDPVTLAFGDVATTGGTKVLGVTVSNTGTGPFTGGTAVVAGTGFTKTLDQFSGIVLAPGSNKAIQVTFDPTSDGAKTGTLTIPAAGQTTVVVNLTGTGTSVAPSTTLLVPRFYLTRQPSPVAAFAEGFGWDGVTSDPDSSLWTAKGGPAVSYGPVVNHIPVSGSSQRLGRWVSPPLAAQSYSGHFTCLAIGYRSSALGSTVTSALRFGIWRTADSHVDWQPVFSQGSAASPWPDSSNPQSRRFPAGASGSWPCTLGFLDGDRLVVELGYRAFSTSTNGARLRYGGASTATDLVDSEAVQDLARAPWVSFTVGLLVKLATP